MSAPSPPVLAIIIVAFDNVPALTRCVASLDASTFKDFDLILVDNSRIEGVASRFANRPGTHVLRTGENLGFAGGNNLGIEKAKDLGAEFAVLLNHDTTVDRECLGFMVEDAKALPNLGVLTPKILLSPDGHLTLYAGGYFNVLRGTGISHGFLATDKPEAGTAREVSYATGTCMLVPMAVIEKIGSLKPENFMYLEDTEFCLRARTRGFRIYYDPRARVLHELGGGVTFDLRPDYYLYFNIRNRPLIAQGPAYRFYLRWAAAAIAAAKILQYSMMPSVPERFSKLRAIFWGWWDSFSTKPRYFRRLSRLFSAR